jgi:hypothetical protein
MKKYLVTGALVTSAMVPVLHFLGTGDWCPKFPSEDLVMYVLGILAMGLIGAMVGNLIGFGVGDLR